MRALSLSQGNSRSVQFASILLAILWLTVSLFVQPVSAQGTTPTDDEVNKIAKQLYCPVCESTPLDVCPTEACRQWRDVIRTMLDRKSTRLNSSHSQISYAVFCLKKKTKKKKNNNKKKKLE